MDVPNVSRNEYQLVSLEGIGDPIDLILFPRQVNIDDGFLNLMTQDGTPKDDVKVPEGDLGKQIEQEFDVGKDLLVTIVSAMGEEQVNCLARFPSSSHLSSVSRPFRLRKLQKALESTDTRSPVIVTCFVALNASSSRFVLGTSRLLYPAQSISPYLFACVRRIFFILSSPVVQEAEVA